MNTVFIVDTYNEFAADISKVRYVMNLNGKKWCIKEVELEWGKPIMPPSFEEGTEPTFKLYDTYEEAREYLREVQKLNGMF